jgi:low temperature requirement protein LtrA
VLIAGYIVMRVSMIGLWARVAVQDPDRRACARDYIVSILVGQVLWCTLFVLDLPVTLTFALMTIPLVIETSGPVIAEKRHGGTPWHPHHIAERYGLLVIITLGEGIIGTVAAMSAYVHVPDVGWTLDAVVILAAGILLTFGMWWSYFALPWGDMLHHHPERGIFWGYGHMVIFGSITATGAGLHLAQYYLEHHSALGTTGTVLAVVLPFAVFSTALYVMYWVSMRVFDAFHLALVLGTAVVLGVAVALAAGGASLPVCLAAVSLAPLVTVVGYEAVGHRHVLDHIERLRE